jgi:hypothetical protein
VVRDAESYTSERPKSMARYAVFVDQKIPQGKDASTPPAGYQSYCNSKQNSRIPVATDRDKMILRFIWKGKETRVTKMI